MFKGLTVEQDESENECPERQEENQQRAMHGSQQRESFKKEVIKVVS